MPDWKLLSSPATANLKEARIQAHYAVNVLAAAGAALIPERSDYSHTALRYHSGLDALVGEYFPDRQLCAAFIFADFSLALLDEKQSILARQNLYGNNLQKAFDWLAAALEKHGQTVGPLQLPEYPDFPEHALADNAEFDAHCQSGVDLLAAYYANTASILQEIQSQEPGASPVTVWPHHFDMATLIQVRPPSQAGGEDGKSVGVGFSPGDASNERPYWYVTPWPYPDAAKLPALAAGHWNTDGWVGALLDAGDLDPSSAQQQQQTVQAFLRGAAGAALDLIRD